MNAGRRIVLLYCPTAYGGLAEHIHYQALALSKLGFKVIVLGSKGYLDRRSVPYTVKRHLSGYPSHLRWGLIRKLLLLVSLVFNQYYLAFYILLKRPVFILLESYTEYFSPFWIWPHIINSRVFGFKYVANIHDPVRDYIVGYLWWHRMSIRLAYIPIEFGLIHSKLTDSSVVPKHVKLAEVPVGIYELDKQVENVEASRKKWGFPADAKIFLAFGYIRDNKNLDLFLRAQVYYKDVYLVVLGAPANSSVKQISFYRELASELGVQNRTYFSDEFVSDSSIKAVFSSVDYILLTYSSSFVSQSGVLNIAAHIQKPVLASSGSGPLKETVLKYGIGVFVEPDNIDEVKKGISALISGDFKPDWLNYSKYASWDTNVRKLLELVNV